MQENMRSELSELSKNQSGLVRIGIQMSDSSLMAKKVLPLFYQTYPNVQLDIYEESSKNLISFLEDGMLDFAILPMMPSLYGKSNIIRTHLASTYPVLLVNQRSHLIDLSERKHGFPHPWIDYKYLANEHFILPHPNTPIYKLFESFKEACGFEPQVLIHAKNMRTQVNCVRQNLGICCTLDHAISSNFYMRELQLLSYGEPAEPGETVIIYKKGHYLTEPASHLMQLFQDVSHNYEVRSRSWPQNRDIQLPPEKEFTHIN